MGTCDQCKKERLSEKSEVACGYDTSGDEMQIVLSRDDAGE
jgi:hypothetical protein